MTRTTLLAVFCLAAFTVGVFTGLIARLGILILARLAVIGTGRTI